MPHLKFSFFSPHFITRTLLIVFVLFATQSCIIHNVAKKQKGIVCDKHEEKMKLTIVGTIYGMGCYQPYSNEFPNAKKKKCMGCVVPIWPTKRLALVYSCKSCTKEMRKERRERKK